MCQFGDSSHILDEKEISQDQAIKGYRAWYINNPFNDKEKFLKSLNQNFNWPKKEIVKGNPTKDNSEGIYNINYNYNNYNYNINYNYNNNNYNNYNNNYYYNYNINYNYNICGSSLLFGKVFFYKYGYRSSLALPLELCILSDKQWFENPDTKQFAEHFNNTVKAIAKEYGCEVIGYDEWLNNK